MAGVECDMSIVSCVSHECLLFLFIFTTFLESPKKLTCEDSIPKANVILTKQVVMIHLQKMDSLKLSLFSGTVARTYGLRGI